MPIAGQPHQSLVAPPFALSHPSPPISRFETPGTSSAAQYLPASSVFVPVNHTRAAKLDAIANGVQRLSVALRQRLESVTVDSVSTRTRTLPSTLVPEMTNGPSPESVSFDVPGHHSQPAPQPRATSTPSTNTPVGRMLSYRTAVVTASPVTSAYQSLPPTRTTFSPPGSQR